MSARPVEPPTLDALTQVLASVRLRSAVFARAALFAPWAVSTRGLDGGIFHAVVRGRCVAIPELPPERTRRSPTSRGGREAARPIELGPGDVVLLPYGDPHVMADRPGRRAVSIRGHVRVPEDGGVGLLALDGGGEETSLVCGRFDVERPLEIAGEGAATPHPLLGLLPRVVHLRASDPTLAPWLPPLVAALAFELDHHEPGSSAVITRLADVLVVHAIRACVRDGSTGEGWLGALRDRRIARALDLVHARPHEPWTAASLAEAVGMGRSAFFERFTALVREPPAQYVARWRMHLAGRSLRDGEASVAEVARRVGYDSEAAFSRAFKRLVGISPGRVRRTV